MMTLNLINRDGTESIISLPLSTNFLVINELMNFDIVECFEIIGVTY